MLLLLSITVVRSRLARRMLLLRPNNYMFLRDGVDFNIPFFNKFFSSLCI